MFETLLPAVAADAAHMKLGQDTATVYGIWAQDSNKHLICLALMTVYDTENKRMWRTLLLAVKEHYPTFDSDEMVCIADGDKGFHAAFTEVLEKGSPFLCAHHKAGNLKTQKGTQKQDIDLFWGAVMASTLSALQGKIADMSLAAQQYLAKTLPSELYLVHVNGRTGGKSSSQLAETGNSTLEELRRMQLGTGLLAFMQSDFARMGKNASAALAADPDIDPLAPKIRKQLNQKLEHKANTGWPFSARFEANCCIVTSLSDPTKSFTLKLGVPGSCSCGESETYGIACDHEIFAARTNNTNLAALYPAYRTVKNWQATYEAMDQLQFPSPNKVHGWVLDDPLPLMPLQTKRQKGRPKGGQDRFRTAQATRTAERLTRQRIAGLQRITRGSARIVAAAAATAAAAAP